MNYPLLKNKSLTKPVFGIILIGHDSKPLTSLNNFFKKNAFVQTEALESEEEEGLHRQTRVNIILHAHINKHLE